MFKCQVCGTQVPRGVPSKLIVTQTRPRIYAQHWVRAVNTPLSKESHMWRDLPRRHNGGKKKGQPHFIEILIPKHVGWEIVEEKRACPACAAAHRAPIPSLSAA